MPAKLAVADEFALSRGHDRRILLVSHRRQAAQAGLADAAVEAAGFDFWDVVHVLLADHAGPLGTPRIQRPDHARAADLAGWGVWDEPPDVDVGRPAWRGGVATDAANILAKHHGLS